MPTESKAPYTEATPQNRRASIPHNLKILAITITPPTPEMVELSESDEDMELDVIASAAATEVKTARTTQRDLSAKGGRLSKKRSRINKNPTIKS